MAQEPSAPEPAAPPLQIPVRVQTQAQPLPARPKADVIESLRRDWLSHESAPKPEMDAAKEKPGHQPHARPPSTLPNYTPFSESLSASIRRRWASLQRHHDVSGVRPAEGRSPLIVISCLLASFAILILVSALLYSAF